MAEYGKTATAGTAAAASNRALSWQATRTQNAKSRIELQPDWRAGVIKDAAVYEADCAPTREERYFWAEVAAQISDKRSSARRRRTMLCGRSAQ